MAKPSGALRSLKMKGKGKKLRPAYLGAIALVLVGGAYAAASTDLAYNAKSLMAQVYSAVDKTPRVVISRSGDSLSGNLWGTSEATLGTFIVTPQNISEGNIDGLAASITVSPEIADYNLRNIHLRYLYCSTSTCKTIEIPISSSSYDRSIYGTTYFLYTAKNLVLPVSATDFKPAAILVSAYPYYSTVYNSSSAPAIKLRAEINAALATGKVCTTANGTKDCTNTSIAVDRSLAYGNWVGLLRGVGFGYGYWDINNNGKLTAPDADAVLKVAVGTLACPYLKYCDIDKSGTTSATDANLLLKYAVGSLPPPPILPMLTVLKPNNGQTFARGSTQTIWWTTANFPTDATVYLELKPANPTSPSMGPVQIAIVPAKNQTYQWQIPTNTPAGQYVIGAYKADKNGVVVSVANESAKDVSDAPFNIQ
jgi:hypothetical protein